MLSASARERNGRPVQIDKRVARVCYTAGHDFKLPGGIMSAESMCCLSRRGRGPNKPASASPQ